MTIDMTPEAELFRLASASFEAAEESHASTLRYLGQQLKKRGADANDVAIEFGVSLDLATRILDGDAMPDDLAALRAAAVTRLVQSIYQDIDSYRNGLLCCRVEDPRTLVVSMTNASDEYCEKYEREANGLGLTIRWSRSGISVLDLQRIIPELDRAAVAEGVDVSDGRIDPMHVTLSTAPSSVRQMALDEYSMWLSISDET